MEYLQMARAWLEGIHPALPWALLTAGIWLFQYGVRREFPALWETIANFGPLADYKLQPAVRLARKVWQALPSILLGAILSAAATGSDVGAIWLGALAGAIAPLKHELLKALPFISYKGKTR